MNIYIPMEVKLRDLEGRTLLALAAAERGHHVIIGRQGQILRLARRGMLPPGLIHMKSIQPGQESKRMKAFRRHGYFITVQDEESGLLDESYDYFAKVRYTREGLDLVERVFCWGEFDQNAMERLYPEYQAKMCNTGSPRVDFWRPEFDRYFNSSGETPNPTGRPYILMASNFAFAHSANPPEVLLEKARKNRFGVTGGDWSEEKFLNGLKYQEQLRDYFVEFLIKLAKTVPEIDVIIRPHPAEWPPEWQKRVQGRADNIHVIQEGGISQWIRGAEAIVHNGCTSGLEAVVSGKAVYAYRPIRSEYDREIPNRVSMEFSSAESLIDELRLRVGETRGDRLNDKPALPASIKERFSSLEGPLATDKMVTEIQDCVPQELRSGDFIALDLKARLRISVDIIKDRFRRLRYRLLDRERFRQHLGRESKFPGLRANEVIDIRDRLTRALGRFEDIEVIKLHDCVFCLRKQSDN